MNKRVKKRFDLPVTNANETHTKTFELEKNVIKVHGLLFTSDRDDLLYYRGSGKVEINRQEIFPEGYESKLLMTGINVSPDTRYYSLGGIDPGNGKIKLDYKDTDTSVIAFAAYRVTLYIDCEVNETV